MRKIRIGHSPDPDDAFMFYALSAGKIPTAELAYEHRLEDIETLNRKAERGEYELTALSFHAYCYVADRYTLLRQGGSFGDGYGPIVVARKEELPAKKTAAATRAWLQGKKVAVPGKFTSARLALRLFSRGLESWGDPNRSGLAPGGGPKFEEEQIAFDEIMPRVAEGVCDAGVIIHEGQLTYADDDRLGLLTDLGVWWKARTGLPLPLGANAIRKDLPAALRAKIAEHAAASVEWALQHRDEALAHAARFGRGLDPERNDRFVGMYVNEYTRDCGELGMAAAKRFLDEGRWAGFISTPVKLEWEGSAAAAGAGK